MTVSPKRENVTAHCELSGFVHTPPQSRITDMQKTHQPSVLIQMGLDEIKEQEDAK